MYDWKLKVKRCFQYLDLNKIEIKDGIVDNLNFPYLLFEWKDNILNRRKTAS